MILDILSLTTEATQFRTNQRKHGATVHEIMCFSVDKVAVSEIYLFRLKLFKIRRIVSCMSDAVSDNWSPFLRDSAYFVFLSIFMAVTIFIVSFSVFGSILFGLDTEGPFMTGASIVIPLSIPTVLLAFMILQFGLPYTRDKCDGCGYENRAGKRSCGECGAKVPVYKRELLFVVLLSVSITVSMISIYGLHNVISGAISYWFIPMVIFSFLGSVVTPFLAFGATYMYKTKYS